MSTIAFIPVRGGSKSIPLKNIKPFCGKPLVCWNIEALEACPEVDKTVVATDSDEIERTVSARQYKKAVIYRRKPENAVDTASTESVMLEYINAAMMSERREPAGGPSHYVDSVANDTPLRPDTVFMLVQATSPLTQAVHFSEALRQYRQGFFDSMLSCVRNYRFFWRPDGTSLNYDYRHRPRRQDFDGMLMENGAFYISTVRDILNSGNRLSGKIGVYEMPAYTAAEIDEPDDWIMMESLMRRHVLVNDKAAKPAVRLFLCDVDGTLTDGGMYYSERGDELKKFNTRDGVAFALLREAGVKTGIITSEDTQINAARAEKLRIDYLRQGQRYGGKLAAAQEICREMGIKMSEVAYIGDDLNCIPLLEAAGVKACPADAQPKVKAVPAIHVMSRRGGDACVREFVEDYILL